MIENSKIQFKCIKKLLMLSNEGWLNGLSSLGIVVSSCLFGLFYIYNSKKYNINLLFYLGLGIFLLGVMYISPYVLDFLTIVLTGNNIDETNILILNTLSWMPLVPITIISLYIGA